MCCPLDCNPNLKPGDPLPCPECRDDYIPRPYRGTKMKHSWAEQTEEIVWERWALTWFLAGFLVGLLVFGVFYIVVLMPGL